MKALFVLGLIIFCVELPLRVTSSGSFCSEATLSATYTFDAPIQHDTETTSTYKWTLNLCNRLTSTMNCEVDFVPIQPYPYLVQSATSNDTCYGAWEYSGGDPLPGALHAGTTYVSFSTSSDDRQYIISHVEVIVACGPGEPLSLSNPFVTRRYSAFMGEEYRFELHSSLVCPPPSGSPGCTSLCVILLCFFGGAVISGALLFIMIKLDCKPLFRYEYQTRSVISPLNGHVEQSRGLYVVGTAG